MIHQLKSIIGFQDSIQRQPETATTEHDSASDDAGLVDTDVLKTRIETLDFSTRTLTALENANIRTLGGLVRKKKDDILALDGIGPKGVEELESILTKMHLGFKE